MKVRLINTARRNDLNKFIRFPFDLYRDNPHWVPPLMREIRQQLDKTRNPFFEHSEADFFLAEENGQVLGRIAAIYNSRYNLSLSVKVGFFYYLESINSLEVTQALFEAVIDWCRQRDLSQLYGPKGMLQGDGIGILVEGFDYMPAMGIPYNFPYYDQHLKEIGFRKSSDYYSGYLKSTDKVPERIIQIAEKVKKRRGFWVRKFTTKEELLAVAPEIREVYNASFSGGEGFSPITEEEMQSIAQRLLSIADPRLIKLIYKEDKMIGFLFAYPNIGGGIRKAKGRFWPFGWYHLWQSSKNTRFLDMNGIGLLPGHQGVGATAVLYQVMEKTFREFDFEHVETVQVREDNRESLAENAALNVNWYKTHRVYVLDL